MGERGPHLEDLDPAPGLAGGPGPTPPGVDDGTPRPAVEGPDAKPRSAGAQDPAAGERDPAAGEASRGGPDRDGAAHGDPEEPDPS